MSFSFFIIVSLSTDGAFWRAVLVALVALIVYALARYWRSLARQTPKTRLLLVSLRATALLLLAFALAGLRVEYDAQMPARVLLYRTVGQTEASARVEEEAAAKRVSASLKAKNIETVERSDANVNENSEGHASYLASIFLTNGAMQASFARREVERASAAAVGSPVYVVTNLEASDGARVALESIAVMNRTSRGVPFTVRCLLHARGMRGRASLVTISDDAAVRVSAQAAWTSDDERQALTLAVVPKTSGWINYTARVEGAGGEEAATLSRSFTIYAEERRVRVLFFEGEPTWEAKFIRRALEESDLFDVDYFAQVSRAAMVGAKELAKQSSDAGAQADESGAKKADAAGGAPDAKLRAALSSATRLNAYDCVIVGATPDAMLSNAEAARVREWVERRGGGLIILGGNSFAGSIVAPKGKLNTLLPAELDSSSFRSDAETLSKGQPVEAEKSRGGSFLTPTTSGASAALGGYLNASEGKERTGVLTGVGLRLGALRAGANVLAVAGQPGASGTGEAGAPLIASARDGAGRAIVFAPADSWRIRTSASGEEAEKGGAFAALWQGLALWSASGAEPPVEVALNEVSPASGSNATAELRVRDENYAPLKIEKVSASLQTLSENSEETQASSDEASSNTATSQEIAFAPDANDPSIWRAKNFVAPQPARFRLEIKYTAGGKSGAAEKYFATVLPAAIETGASTDTLRRTARETGGELFAASDLNSLTDRLASLSQGRQTVRRTFDLRTWWPLALIITLLLSCEWLIQRIRFKV